MHAAALRIELRIPLANSLKAKRGVVRPLVEGLRRVASLSVSEIDRHDSWQLSTLGVAIVAPDAGHLERLIGEYDAARGQQCVERRAEPGTHRHVGGVIAGAEIGMDQYRCGAELPGRSHDRHGRLRWRRWSGR